MQEKKIGEIIAEAREKQGLSQRQLAKIANISNAELSKIESGEREIPNPKTLRKISKHIDVNYNVMMSMIGLGMEVLNPFIKDYYEKMNLDQLEEAEINVLGSIANSEQLIKSCEHSLTRKDITEQEIELLQHTIEDTQYQVNTSNAIVDLIQDLKVKERIKIEKRKKNK